MYVSFQYLVAAVKLVRREMYVCFQQSTLDDSLMWLILCYYFDNKITKMRILKIIYRYIKRDKIKNNNISDKIEIIVMKDKV